MSWTPVCDINEIVPNTGVGALVDGHQIAIFRLDDNRVFALDNFDPHSQANVLARGIVGDLGGELVVASPIYKQHFRLTDGACLEDPGSAVSAYAVSTRDGRILVDCQNRMGCAA